MKLWDLVEFDDLEYLGMYVAEELGAADLRGAVVLCPRGHSLVIPGVESKNLLTLKISFRKQLQRFFLAMLHAYKEMELTSTPICFSARELNVGSTENFDWGVLSLLNQVFVFVESSQTKEVDFADLKLLINNEKFIDLGELGVAFQVEAKKVLSPYVYYHKFIMNHGTLSSGQLRSVGIADAIGLHWRFLLDDNLWQIQCGSDVLRNRLERISVLLSKCYTRPTYKHYDYESEFWPYLLAACAGWFFRMAINLRSSSNKSSSTLCLTRVFELALQAQALYCKAAHLESNGEIFFKDVQLEGCGKIVSLVEARKVRCQVKDTEIGDWVIRARTLLSVRNKSRLAHGIDDVDQDGYADVMKSLKVLLSELLEPGLNDELMVTCSELALPPFRAQFVVGLDRLLRDYLY